ncbi:MAG: hemolysin III family protein [Deltaproteobacteria bacterium]|nr:hemolysin III family protein [Deltaproteobacteria bacterium]
MHRSLISDQTHSQEIASSIVHAVGLVLALGGTAVLITFASLYGNVWHIVGVSVYSATLILLYGSSTLYHLINSDSVKKWFRLADHVCIYLLIAGTYTPFTFVTIKGGWGWSLFGIQWGLAVTGITFKVFFINRFTLLSNLTYLGMGWVIIIALLPLIENLPGWGFLWLAMGGLAYSFGIIFFIKDRIGFNHAIWHGMVMIGSICHFITIFFYVLP